MIWLMTIGVFWYAWGVYTLSYNPDQFPDPAYALKIWHKRASYNAFLGGSILTATLVFNGTLRLWWVGGLVFVGSCIVAAALQLGLIELVILVRALKARFKIKHGRKARRPFLAPIVWTFYISEEEKQTAETDSARSNAGRPIE
jgi:hypothetical protein